ncbi:hypothetical protein J2848_000165 [Azospirillum lipoferum]|uniref:Lipoprotein n=1 Tax=Azospirillum lipoferum TaxID=193 RepID=A0A5A9GUH1_AZOLI|nr:MULTISPECIES: hypothetical protein [Azospirillum]KAA0597039.1 hypothetical protein FZ942_07985 [Azospirillum lipoferum]MCP1608529.1 hypothetical protein [Azospirillum lipoferum]MDW5536152.1 hypothetical protein [Azospirillum sp. NL1]
MTRTVLLVFGAVVLLAGCQEDGAPRPVHLDKGVYQGAVDTPLTAEQLRALQQRTAYQAVR